MPAGAHRLAYGLQISLPVFNPRQEVKHGAVMPHIVEVIWQRCMKNVCFDPGYGSDALAKPLAGGLKPVGEISKTVTC